MNEVCAAALLALSGAATPSIAPRPNRDGSLAIFFSSVYAANDAITAPPPGRMPRIEPSTAISTVATQPAKNEPIAAIASAGPARPCLAI